MKGQWKNPQPTILTVQGDTFNLYIMSDQQF